MCEIYEIDTMEQYDKILEAIWRQRDNMLMHTNIKPNKVVLGRYVRDVLRSVSGAMFYLRNEENYDEEVFGLPITVDVRNPYTIEVCYRVDKSDIRDFFDVKRH